MQLNVAIIMANSLEALGVKHLLREAYDVSTHVLGSASEFESGDGALDYDLIFCDATTFAFHLDFFLPRQSRVVLITDACCQSAHGGIRWIASDSGEKAIAAAFDEIISEKQAGQDTGAQAELSARERDVLRLVASGMINKEIANTLNISVNTVLTHRKNITAKLGIKSVSGLSVYAMMNGLIAPV